MYVEGQYKIVVFYEGLLQALAEAGNEILFINSADYLHKPWNGGNDTSTMVSQERLLNTVTTFAPEAIIAFNHSIPRCILEKTECPVAVWDADSINFYNDKEYIRTHMDRYVFLCFSDRGIQSAQVFGAKNGKIYKITAATSMKAENVAQTIPISFIGTAFEVPASFVKLLNDPRADGIKNVIDELSADFYHDSKAIIDKHKAHWVYEYLDPQILCDLGSAHSRTSYLNDLVPLGLKIYGTQNWTKTGYFLPKLALSYDRQLVYSIRHNQDIYNASKICFNISHTQAIDGFPWRIVDIMATNGCLLSDYKRGLADFSKGYVDIPMFTDKTEAYSLAKKLLENESWRREIVEGSKACIEAKGRWHHRFDALGDALNLRVSADPVAQPMKPDATFTVLKPKPSLFNKLVFTPLIAAARIIPLPFQKLIYKILMFLNFRIPYWVVSTLKRNTIKHDQAF